MAARTYIPQLRVFLQHVSKYLARYTTLMLPHLSDVQASALLAFQLALNELIDRLGPVEIGP